MQGYEAVVVGLGATGSAAVYQLAQAGVRVLGIDRLAPPHTYGSSHGDTRITRLAIGEGDVYVPFVRRSHELWREIEVDSGAGLLHQVGGVVISPVAGGAAMHGSDDFFSATVDIARRHGVDHEVLDAGQLADRFPQFGVGAEHAGYFEPDAGFVMAEAAVRAQLDLAVRHGAQLRRDERVLDVLPSGDGVVVRTDRGRYGAGTAVLAAGPWLPELIDPDLGGLFTVYRQVVNWFAGDLADGSFEPDRCPVFIWQFGPGEEDVCYGFPAIDGPGGGVKVGTEHYGSPVTPDTVRREVLPSEVEQTYHRCVAGRLPALRAAAVRSVSCLYTVTPDFGFVVDRHPLHHGVIVASPCSGHGFKHSAAVGESIAQLVTTGTSTLDLSPFALGRLTSPAGGSGSGGRR
ncbi:N-methyl-L-tryptophan oxidase [Phytoactinopolyspora alkaliphila]|uniref:N-methyl-L-tryptophan oxidase n=1 Tax=Phytoactinopolyspora alkaliphila TaxID=1783498 RepID=A0A6N9YU77_9ACTN|nr:N-methyl-L-tryptophan oxidase [Phytoactinopolyspora alkaliphila]NED98497.1 N-methyl-L-tryptophan oxidase [Phytoactinopolyspora alkaliphila]